VNLKQAARRLGVHYQTAYKLVRTGRLSAIRIGGSYEISEAAVERYLAERDAMRRGSDTVAAVPPAPPDRLDLFAGLRAALEATRTDARPVLEIACETLCDGLGDLAIVRELSADGAEFLPAVVRHRDPRTRAIATEAMGGARSTTADSLQRRAIEQRTPLLMPHVPQDRLRERTPQQLVQYLDEVPVHSLIGVPVTVDRRCVALLTVVRNAPGSPYGPSDLPFVEEVAAFVGRAIGRARAGADAHARLETLMVAVGATFAAHADEPTDRLEHDLAAVLGDGPVAEIVTDRDGTVVAANAGAASLHRRDRADLLGCSLADLDDDAEHVERDLERLVTGELTYLDDVRSVGDGDGGRVEVALAQGVVRDAGSVPLACVFVEQPLGSPVLASS
jgi:excisionase family DNA binding protein